MRKQRDPDRLIRVLLLSAIAVALVVGMVMFVLYLLFVLETVREL